MKYMGSKARIAKYYLIFLFISSIMFFMRFEIITIFCMNYPCMKYCADYLGRLIYG